MAAGRASGILAGPLAVVLQLDIDPAFQEVVWLKWHSHMPS
jgi:hypothetical protein